MSGGSGPDWAPERVVTEDEAAALVGERFPQLRGAVARRLATGWDNTVMRVGDDWIFRFPRRQIAVPGVTREIAVLPRLAPRLPLPIPVPSLAAPEGMETFPWPFWGGRLVPGRELAESRLGEDEREAAGRGIGAFLRALHDPALVAEVGADLPYDPLRRGEPAVRAPMALERLDGLAKAGVWSRDPGVERFLAEAANAAAPGGPGVVSHGDLHVRHLLVDEAGRASGVIDWGDLCVADPAVDLSLAYAGFSGRARATLLAEYGSEPSAVAARTLAIFICSVLAAYAADEGRERLLAEALAGIRRSVGD
ncbi:phosphotransferase [Actinomadura barringtoniae]|uniref:phosphotransferase n=1 Tax=Actinomadura barringtoniae TaxID=1427535 RepID=UPI0027DAE9FD|nr:phosphotransferase [Actinomadura barringtoniae]